ncbi:MAG: trimethylamine methyltransferase family protein, partial [Rubrivivax sp.]
MARLVGALGTSHAPSIAFAHDAGHQERPEWRGFFAAWAPVRQWLARIGADTLALTEIAEVGPGGHFFGTPRTISTFETAFYRPLVSATQNYGAW